MEQRRRTKQHRKVDRAASKGRKTRYTVQVRISVSERDGIARMSDDLGTHPHAYAVQSRLPPRRFPAAAAHDDVVGF